MTRLTDTRAPSHFVTTHLAASLSSRLLVVAPFWAALLFLRTVLTGSVAYIQIIASASDSIFQGCSGEQIRHGLGYLGQLSCHLECVTGKLDSSGSRSYTLCGRD